MPINMTEQSKPAWRAGHYTDDLHAYPCILCLLGISFQRLSNLVGPLVSLDASGHVSDDAPSDRFQLCFPTSVRHRMFSERSGVQHVLKHSEGSQTQMQQ